MVWAIKDAPTRDPFEHSVLSVMADEADEDGCGVWLSVPTIAERGKMSDREARDCVKALLERGLIGYGDQDEVPARIRRDRRPVCYDLLIPVSWYSAQVLARVNRFRRDKGRESLTSQGCGRESCASRPATARGPRCPHRPDIAPPPPKKRRSDLGKPRPKKDANGVTVSTPVEEVPNGVTDSPGGLLNTDGVTDRSERGDYQSPNPVSSNPDEDNPPPTPVINNSPEAVPTDKNQGGDNFSNPRPKDPADQLVAELIALAPPWRLLAVRTREALADPGVQSHPFEVVRLALLELAEGKHGPTRSPRRVLEDGPWWDAAYHRVAAAMGPALPSPREAAIADCDLCDPSGWILDVEPVRRCTHVAVAASA